MREYFLYLPSILLAFLGASTIHAENSETRSLTLFAQRACEESLVIQPQSDSRASLSITNDLSIEDIARKLLAGLSQQLDEKPEILAREINALVEGTLIFKNGLVAHLVNIELSRQFEFESNDLAKSRLKIEAFPSLTHEKKMEISLRASERILYLLTSLKNENTEKRRKDLKLSESEYEKMIDEWISFRKYDPALHRLQFAILTLLQFKPSYFFSHFANFTGWLKGYRRSYYSLTGDIPRQDLPEMKPRVRLIDLADSPLKYFAESDIWTGIRERYGYRLLSETKYFNIEYTEFIILRFLKSFHLEGLKALAKPDMMEKYTSYTQDILKNEIDFLTSQLDAQNSAINKVKELENKKSETEITIQAIKTQISNLTQEKEHKIKLKAEVERSDKSVFMLEIIWALGNLNQNYLYPHPENAIEIRKVFAKYRRQISSEDFLIFIDLILPHIAIKDFGSFEEKSHYNSHNISKRRWSNWAAAWLLFFRGLSIFVNLDPAQKRYVLDHVREKFVMSENVSVEWAAEFDKKYLRIGDWGLGDQPNPDKTPSSKSVIEFIQAEVQTVENKIKDLDAELKIQNESLSNTNAELKKAQEHNESVNRKIDEGKAASN